MKYLWLLLLTSCSTSLKLNSFDCPSYVELMPQAQRASEQKSFSWSEFGVGEQPVKLNEMLKEKVGLGCRDLASLRLTIARTGWDQTLSLIPFYSRWTITMEWNRPKSK